MLTTNNNQALNFYASGPTDGTVYVNPGVAMVDYLVMDFQGGYKTFAEMTTPQLQGYQYSVLFLQNVNNFPDMSTAIFTPVDSTSKLTPPYVNYGTKPLGLFLFYGDGTNVTLTSANKVQ